MYRQDALMWVKRVCKSTLSMKDPAGFVKQRPENPLLYLYQEGEKKRGQASKVARAVRATIFTPRTPRQGGTRESSRVAQHHRRDTAHYRGVSMCSFPCID